MLKKRVEKALNTQANAEMWSAHLYLSMSLQLSAEGLGGFAQWMRIQYQEEVQHAFKIMRFLVERGGKPTLSDIKDIPVDFGSTVEIFELALEHEKKVTDNIDKLVDLIREENDKATEYALQWFVTEQVEEEATLVGIIEKLKRIGDGAGLYMLDKELAARQ